MEILMSGEFGRAFFAIGSAIVVSIIWFAYFRSVFIIWLSNTVVIILILYMTTFLTYRYVTDHMAEHAAKETHYVLMAAVHGTISFFAVGGAVSLFLATARAMKRNENYIRLHPVFSLLVVLLWPLALFSGLLL